jgi:hypothetical protein
VSVTVVSAASRSCSVSTQPRSSALLRTRRVAFQILLAKLRPVSTFFSSKKVSCPGGDNITVEKRRASAPY